MGKKKRGARAPRHLSWTALGVSCLAGCAAPGGSSGSVDQAFCSRLASGPGCSGEMPGCLDHNGVERVNNPRCTAVFDRLLSCLTPLQFACQTRPDFIVTINGDGTANSDLLAYNAIYLLRIQDRACAAIGREYLTCRDCNQVNGYGTSARGVGDHCTGSECAAGLTCTNGMCTRSCATDRDCGGNHTAPSQCRNEYMLDNRCVNGQCTSACDVGNNFCMAYGAGWMCGGFGAYCAR